MTSKNIAEEAEGLDIESLVREYLTFCEKQKKLSAATMKGYRIDLCQFLESQSNSVPILSKETLNRFCRALNEKYMPRTVKRKMASVHAFCRWLEFEEVIDSDPFRKVNTKIQQIKQIPQYLPLASMEQILNTAYRRQREADRRKPAYKVSVQNVAVLELLFATGIRVSELCALRRENYQTHPGAIRVLGKGNKERIIPLENREVIMALEKHIALYSDLIENQGYLFYNQRKMPLSQQSVRNMVSKYARESGIPGKTTPHVIRHTFATLMLEQEVDIRYIQTLLGHSSIRTTEIYTTVSCTKERQIMATKHPRNLLTLFAG